MMGYDPALGRVVLFGGYDPAIQPLGDTWTSHAGTWTQVAGLTLSPSARWAGGFTYDPQLGGMLLFGGRSLSTFFTDTWLYNSTGWHHLRTATHPSPRSGSALAYDPITGKALLFGGGIGNLPAGSGSVFTFYSDTWTFDGKAWTNISAKVGIGPSARFGGQLAWDPTDRYMFFEGGNGIFANGTQVPMNDSWSFAGGGWTQLSTSGSLPAVVSANGGVMTWDVKAGTFVLYGGEFGSVVTSQTWTYVSGAWTNLTGSIVHSPTPRSNSGFTDDLSDGYLILFAGTSPPPNYTYHQDSRALV
jgi:hypothetical protein